MTLVCCVLTALLSIQSSASNCYLRSYQVGSGLSENTVYAILQDNEGFMWFGTKDGLNRFDGREFKVYRSIANDSTSLGNNTIRSLVQIDYETIGVGTDIGLFMYDCRSDSFRKFDRVSQDSLKIGTWVNDLKTDSKNNLWIATNDGVFIYNLLSGEFRHFGTQNSSIPSDTVWKIFLSKDGNIWIGTREGLVQYTHNNGQFRSLAREGVRIGDDEIISVQEDSRGNLLLGTWSGGLLYYKLKTGDFTPSLNLSRKERVRAILAVSSDTIAIGSDQALNFFNPGTGKIQRMDIAGIYCLFNDKEGGLWIGTILNGIRYLTPRNLEIELYPGGENGFSGNVVSSICQDRDGDLWVGAQDGGVSLFDPESKTFAAIPALDGCKAIKCLYDDGNKLIIGTFAEGLFIYDKATRKVRNYRRKDGDDTSLSDNSVYSILRTTGGDLFIGTAKGLNKMSGGTSFSRLPEFRDVFVYDLLEDDGTLWIAGHSKGVLALNLQSGEVKSYQHSDSDPSSLGYFKVTGIYRDRNRQIWFSTDGGGISRYNRETDNFTSFNETTGLPNNMVYAILDDSFGRLWLSSNAGLTCISGETGEVLKHYTQSDGLQSDEFNYKAAFKDGDGKLYFGGIDGFNAFFPEDLSSNNVIPSVKVTSVTALNADSEFNRELKGRLLTGSVLELPAQHRSISITFSALSFLNPEQNLFAYRMYGVDDDFCLTNSKNEVSYINLPPGKYRFVVKACNSDGVWNDEGASIGITVRPPFYASITAIILYILAVCTLLCLVFIKLSKRNALVQQRKAKEQIEINERDNLNSKISFFTQITHEIRTPLTLIKAPLESIIKSGDGNEATKSNLETISRNTDRLYELVTQLLDFRKLENSSYSLHYTSFNLLSLAKSISDSFAMQNAEIRLSSDAADESCFDIVSDKDALTKILTNLLSNAVKFTDSTVDICLKRQDGEILLSVSDNGSGIPDEQKRKIFEPFYQIQSDSSQGTGIGLSLVASLVEKLGYTINVRDNRPKGSVFELAIKQVRLPQTHEAIAVETQDKPVILYAEDNSELRQFLSGSFPDEYEIVTASDGKEALSILKSRYIDLLIADILMPQMGGMSLLEAVRADSELCHIPVILLSAKTDENTKVGGLKAGADIFMEKPFSLSHLIAQTESLLQNRAMLKSDLRQAPIAKQVDYIRTDSDKLFFKKVDDDIMVHLADTEYSPEQMALTMCISQSSLQRKFKGVCGITPNAYIRIFRLKKASELLLTSGCRVNEVCYMVGFSSPSYFAKCFSEQFGVLPRDWAKSKQSDGVVTL